MIKKVMMIMMKVIMIMKVMIKMMMTIMMIMMMMIMMYHSSSASAALSTLVLRLTPPAIPPTLFRVHIKIIVAGVVFRKTLEADEDLVYTYAWDKRNVYNQKVYSPTEARVSVGYQYQDCDATIWETHTTMMSGFQVDISDIGGWNIDIHHHYNAFEGRAAGEY